MRSIRPLRIATLVAVAALASACSDSTGPSDLAPTGLAAVLAELQPSSLAGVNGQLSPAPVAALSAPNPSSCSYDATTKSFVCPNVSVTGVTVSRRFTLLDASGAAQSAYDASTTAAVRMETGFAGTVTTNGVSFTIDQAQDVTLSGLLTGVHTLNGGALAHVNGTVTNGTTTTPIASTITTTITNLVLPQGGSQFPASGTVAATTTTTVGALPPTTASTTITFNGTSHAAVTVTVNGVTAQCSVDLTAQTPSLCSV